MTDFFRSLDAARERAGFAHTLGDGTEEYAEKAAERCTDPRCEHGVPGACPTEPSADREAGR